MGQPSTTVGKISTGARLPQDAAGVPLGGTYPHGLDTKFRVVVPALFRDLFAPGGYLFQMSREGNYVALYPMDRFRSFLADVRYRIAEGMSEAPLLAAVLDRSKPFLPDLQGRVFIPPEFREFAELGDAVEMRGRETHLAVMRAPVPEPDSHIREAVDDYFKTALP